eukprot:XP_001610055.1 hypothetical protein [Babesia bovis T2Bo]
MRGAHLMVPGVINWPCEIPVGTITAVVIDGSPYPVAVGICENMFDASGKVRTNGRALEVLHYYGDDLWKLTSKPFPGFDDLSGNSPDATGADNDQSVVADSTIPNPSEPTDDSSNDLVQAMENTTIIGSAPESVSSGTHGDTEQDLGFTSQDTLQEDIASEAKTVSYERLDIPVKLVDHALRLCFLQTLHGLSDSQLPMEISALYSEMSVSSSKLLAVPGFIRALRDVDDFNIPIDKSAQLISYRNSSFKKLIKMFQTWSKEGLILMKDIRGTGVVVNINRGHTVYVQFKPWQLPQNKEPSVSKVEKVKVKRYVAFSSSQRKMLAEKGVQVDKEPMPLDMFKKLIIEHVSSEGPVILQHVNDAVQYHQITHGENESPIKKGAALPVSVLVEPRGNRKHVTTVKGLFTYLFDLDESQVAEILRRKFASSVSVNDGIVIIQGNVPIERELVDCFGMSPQQIKITRRG